ncbi:hypothetical protein Ddye_012045 [Dipteronia dyeriana]|uniref:Transposase n=1 Tax=Dipteronia dyeriana TaxID=168575 RepID=A0AAD9X3J6_9ROSI|nr:hypothetical protein Ddye_012045 [Dipteronia dyeriana]
MGGLYQFNSEANRSIFNQRAASKSLIPDHRLISDPISDRRFSSSFHRYAIGMSGTPSTGTSSTQGQDHQRPLLSQSTSDGINNIDVEFNALECDSNVIENGKRKLTSNVWLHFDREKRDDVWTAICKNCKKRLSAKSRSGTTHLHGYLERCPRRVFHDVKQMLKATKTKEGDVKLSTFQFDQDIARRELANMVILHEYPLSIVDHSGFQRFLTSVQPMFKIPTTNTLKSDIMKMYEYERVKILDLLKRNKGRIAITTDMWTCNNQSLHVQCPHTSVVLADAMMDCILDWHLEKKVSALTVDNCSTNNAMIPIILDKLSRDSTLLNGEMFHMRCSAHVLNLVVKEGLDVINDSIDRIQGSVSYWTGLPKREEKFLETVRELEIVSTKKLALDCKKRWNSTFVMIRSALIYKTVFPHLRQRDSQFKCVPTENDWVFAKEISDRLEVFFVATEQFSGTKYPTANNYLPILCDIRYAISQWGTSRYKTLTFHRTTITLKKTLDFILVDKDDFRGKE